MQQPVLQQKMPRTDRLEVRPTNVLLNKTAMILAILTRVASALYLLPICRGTIRYELI